jgi:hypothetical protein
MSCKGGSAYIISPRLQGSTIKISESLMGTARLMRCSNGTYYLRVTPQIVWVTVDGVGGNFKINSNTDWEIK